MSALAEVLDRFEILERLRAIIAELEPGGDGPEVASALAAGLLEELVSALDEDEQKRAAA